ncbi:MAG: sulfatase [Planctomycetota bacterium]|jgi:arylsulfatase A-like enzyme
MPSEKKHMPDRRAFLRYASLAALAGLNPACAFFAPNGEKKSAGGQGIQKPNILFIVVDDLRPQLGCYDHAEMHSPNIDALAVRGTVFERAYCNVPVCGPSRASVLTGIRPESGQWRCSDLKTDFITLPALFRRHGYHAISIGKVLHHMHDQQEDWSRPPWRSAEIYHGKEDWAKYNTYGLWHDPTAANHVNEKSGRGPYMDAGDVPDSAYQDGLVADRTIAELRALKQSGEPFFLACGFWRPHLPFNAPRKYWELYKREEIEMAENRHRPKNLPETCRSSREIDRYSLTGSRKKTDEFHREARHAYYACVSYVDAQVGRVIAALDELALAKETVIVLWGDHGWHLGEHEFWGKHNTLNHSLHAPLIVCAPDHRKNNSTDALVEFVDIYPTLCELSGLPVPAHAQGRSFVPLLDQPELEWKQAVFSKWTGCEAVKTDRYLYTQWKKGQEMLFDHLSDPEENVNIADDPRFSDIVEQHRELLMTGWRGVTSKNND